MTTRTIEIPNISCGHCVNAVATELGELEGVAAVRGDPATKQVTVDFAPPATWEAIAALLDEIGYPPAPESA